MSTNNDLIQELKSFSQNGLLLPSAYENLTSWLSADFLPDWALASIKELILQKSWDELNDRFFKLLVFGTGGMRSRTIAKIPTSIEKGTGSSPQFAAVGTNMLNDFNIIRATIGLFNYSKASFGPKINPSLVIAHDMRYFSRHFCLLTASTWDKLGGTVFIFDGPRSTPQLSFSVRYLNATAGVVITASHNPPHDNGFKVYFSDGGQVVSPHAESIINAVNSVQLSQITQFLHVDQENINILPPSADQAYLDVVKNAILDPELVKAHSPKVVFTPLHGTGQVIALPAMKAFNIDFSVVQSQIPMDPQFSTVSSPNPENPAAFTLAIQQADQIGANLIIATDPDGDRMGIAARFNDNKITLLNGNIIGSILAEYRINKLKQLGWIPQEGTPSATLIKTFVTTNLQDAIAKKHGLKLINTLTGFKWIGEKLNDYQLQLENKLKSLGQHIRPLSKLSGLPSGKEKIFEGPQCTKGVHEDPDEIFDTARGQTTEFPKRSIDYHSLSPLDRCKLLQQYSTYFVLGAEESYGFLADDRVRDKDANTAILQICELAASLKSQNLSFEDYLNSIYLNYGYFTEDILNLQFEGAIGAFKIKKILASYRTSPPKSIQNFKVSSIDDFASTDFFDADGKKIPHEDFFFVHLEDNRPLSKPCILSSGKEKIFEGPQCTTSVHEDPDEIFDTARGQKTEFRDRSNYNYAVRASGTEPKIKFYLFASEPVENLAALSKIKLKAKEKLAALKNALLADTHSRIE